MKTWIVRTPDGTRSWFGNAESAEEAVAYAIAKGNLPPVKSFVVYDHDLNRFEVSDGERVDA